MSDTVLSNLRCHANLAETIVSMAETAAILVHNTKSLFNVKLYLYTNHQGVLE